MVGSEFKFSVERIKSSAEVWKSSSVVTDWKVVWCLQVNKKNVGVRILGGCILTARRARPTTVELSLGRKR